MGEGPMDQECKVQVIGSVCSQDATGDCVGICESENDQECKTSPLHGACQTLPVNATEPYERMASSSLCLRWRKEPART
jgi:hypothetical protein